MKHGLRLLFIVSLIYGLELIFLQSDTSNAIGKWLFANVRAWHIATFLLLIGSIGLLVTVFVQESHSSKEDEGLTK